MSENLENLEFKVVDDWPNWSAFKPEKAEMDGVKYLRKRGSDVIYKKRVNEKGI